MNMDDRQFVIDILELYWINDSKDDPDDLCLHGKVNVTIGDEMVAEKYPCTVSSTALYLLKSIGEDHKPGEASNQMLPHCGHMLIPNKTHDTVDICGCPIGIDWFVLHTNGKVELMTETGTEVTMDPDQYRLEVFRFADKVEDFYRACNPKNLPVDDFDKEGYVKFWREWICRRGRV